MYRLKDRGWVELVPVFTFPDKRHLRIIEVNALTPDGVVAVAALYDRDPETTGIRPVSSGNVEPVPESINHELAVRDALVYLLRMVETHDVPLHWWTMDTRALVAAKQTALRQAPDLILVAGEERIPLLVEVDLGTESIDSDARNSWMHKYDGYARYLDQDAGRDSLFDGCGVPRVVVLGTGSRRVRNVKQALEGWGADRRWWFSTLEEICPVTYRPNSHQFYQAGVTGLQSLVDVLCLKAGL